MTASRRTLDRTVSEAALQKAVIQMAEALGWTVWHDNDSRRNAAGLPDLICVHPGQGRVLWLELKRETGRVRPSQRLWLEMLTAAGQEAHLVRPRDLDEIERLLSGEGC